jgi:hypothetical protein
MGYNQDHYTHYNRAGEILMELDQAGGLPPTLLIMVAQVHATLALAEAASHTTHAMHPAQPTAPDPTSMVIDR